MMRQVIHLPTSQSLVDDASFFALSPVKNFYRTYDMIDKKKKCVVFYPFGSLDRVAGLLVTLKLF